VHPFSQPRWRIYPLAALLGAACACAHADEPTKTEQKIAPTAFNREEPVPKLQWGVGDGKSYWLPAAEIVAFDVLLSQFNRRYVEPREDYDSDWDSIERNFNGKWVYDSDGFDVNQFGHPYQGNIYHNFARTAGLGYWEAQAYTFLGSAFWEITGETTPPSINDQFTTGIGGSFLGEPLFRMGSLLLEGARGEPSFLRELANSVISLGTNRVYFGDRFDGVFRSHDPAVHTRATLGSNVNSRARSSVNTNPDPAGADVPQRYESGTAVLDFTMAYGLPGKPGYRYDQPFDYFHFEFSGSSNNAFESIMTRGLLLGAPYGDGAHYRGIWGLYGSYDYIAPQIFRVSNTALNLGTTGQWWISENTALQCELIAGAGYGSGGVTESATGLRDYHYGITPQALGALRFIFADLAVLELAGRDYYVSDSGSDAPAGSENIARADVSLTLRVHGLHGVTVRWSMTDRQAKYEAQPDTEQRVAAISVGYTYIGHPWFGAVDWRPKPEQRTDEKLEDAKDEVLDKAEDIKEKTEEIVK
jgi:hypothetical protein